MTIVSADETRTQLCGAVYRGDTTALLALLADGTWPPDALQLIGDGLLDALRTGNHAAAPAARDCVTRLRDRGWEGDDTLADALDAQIGTGPVPLLRPLPVDLDLLIMALETDRFTDPARINTATGEWAEPDSEFDDPDDEDDDQWLWVEPQGSRDGYRDMEAFIDRLDNDHAADLLAVAIQGRGAFRRFKDTLARWPDLLQEWFAFSDDRQRGRARAWLADQGYTPIRGPQTS